MNSARDDNNSTILGRFAGQAGDSDHAVQVNDYIYISKAMGDSILITTPEGDVVVNAGLPGAGAEHRSRFAKVSDNPLRYIILTQCHANQFGGVQAMREPGTRVIAQARYPECRDYWRALHDFYAERSGKLWGSVLGIDRSDLKSKVEEAQLDILFDDTYQLVLGGRQLELYATPGGESLDSLVVWLPQDNIAVVGNLFGPIFGHLPNLYTLRGDKIRSALRYIESIERVKAMQPAMLISGHEVIEGVELIRQTITRLGDAVRYIYDKTIEGMNAGRDVQSLMRDIHLPERLRVGQGHGKTSWCVRAIWEEYAGWFHYDSTTSLYGSSASEVAGDIAEMVGGVDALSARARHYLSLRQPLKAIHLLDIALADAPENADALQASIEAHQQLLDDSGSETFSEVMWLKSEIRIAQQKLIKQQEK